ncbi:hypothetical protein GCM10010168_90520 [Actinoplanes ianthinogenes]|nr:hypothetical protein GCM10010168_90520 [Actinoplanes ianthinogenes]
MAPVRMEPRQHLLETWKVTVNTCWRDGAWDWDGRDGSHSISDAEQLLCLLRPATQLPPFALDRPNLTAEHILEVLAPLGNEKTIPLRLVDIATEFFTRHVDGTGRPIFSGGGYLSARDDDRLPDVQRDRDIVESFAVSVTLCLATIGFVRVFRQAVTRREILERLRVLEQLASARLTAALIGLLRSFALYVFDADDDPGRILIGTINKSGLPAKQVVGQFRDALQETIASFEEVLIGSGQTRELSYDNRLFECGWSWGIVADAPRVETATAEDIGEQPDGVADNRPNLYFTVVAVDAIEELLTERTRVLGLLNEEQQRLTRALQLRWDLTVGYWATVATFGGGPVWPLEDPPWTTTDGLSSEYHTLLLTSITVKDLVRRRGSDAELARIGTLLADLANEARVTRRHRPGDSGIRLHAPGLPIALESRAGGDEVRAVWVVQDFAPQLMERCLVIAGLLRDVDERARLVHLADRIWDHLVRRRQDRGLWDRPDRVFEELPEHAGVSWRLTERAIRCMVGAAHLVSAEPPVNDRLVVQARDLLHEAEHRYDMELMHGNDRVSPGVHDVLVRARASLERARRCARTRPGTAVALASTVLVLLDQLDAVRANDSTVF